MKRIKQLLTVACLLLAFSASAAQQSELFTLYTQYTPGDLPASGVTITDDFDRADSATLGANWTISVGSIGITNNQAIQITEGYGQILAKCATETSSVTQYGKVTLDGSQALGSGIYPQILLRVNGTAECYAVEARPNEDQIVWLVYTNTTGGNATTIASAAATVATNSTWGATISGTGTSTTIRVWIDPTNTPATADSWDGDATPTVTFTDNPANEANTGKGVGVAVYASNLGYVRLNNFTAGDTTP
jgi:hypothetical protein